MGGIPVKTSQAIQKMGAAQFTPAETIVGTCEEINKLLKHIEERMTLADPDPAYIETVKRVIEQHEAHLVQQCAADPDPQLQANILEIKFEDKRIPEAGAAPYKAALKALQDRIAEATGKPYQSDERGKLIRRTKRELEWRTIEIADLQNLMRKKGSAWTPPELPYQLEAMKHRKAFLEEELVRLTAGMKSHQT